MQMRELWRIFVSAYQAQGRGAGHSISPPHHLFDRGYHALLSLVFTLSYRCFARIPHLMSDIFQPQKTTTLG